MDHVGISRNGGPKNRPQYIMLLLIGASEKGPLIFGDPPEVGPRYAHQSTDLPGTQGPDEA